MCRAADPGKITTFCASVAKSGSASDNFGDDQRHAVEVARLLGVKLIKVPTETDLIEQLPAMMWQLDEPTADFSALQTLALARAARDSGIKVLLSGIGGDDLFAGYSRHRAAMIYEMLSRIPGGRVATGALARLFPAGGLRSRRLRRTGELLAMDEEIMLTEAMSFSAVTGQHRLALLSSEVRGEVEATTVPVAFAASFEATKGLHPVERALDLELNGFMPDHNLNYTDKMAMQTGVEVRVPLCDPKLVEFAMQLPIADKIDLWQTKKILRASQINRIPQSVLGRPKQGFGVPMRGWLRGAARPLMEELTSESVVSARGLFDTRAVTALRDAFLSSAVDAALTLFPLMAIEVWCRALDTAPTVAGPATGPTYRMAMP